MMHPAFASAERRRAALNKLKKMEPHPLKAPTVGGRYTVLVHKSTRRPGWWQATFFDDEGPWGDSESCSWPKLLEHIHMDSVDWTLAERARAKPNQGHLFSVESIAEMGEGEFEDYYPESASGELEDEQTPYFGRNVIWIGDEGKMLRADPDYMQHIFGNIFDPDKLASIVNGIHDHSDRVRFYAPYGTASRIDAQQVAESQQYWEDEGLDRPFTTGDDELDAYLKDPQSAIDDELIDFYSDDDSDDEDEIRSKAKADFDKRVKEAEDDEDGDLGSWVITVRDGNHRAFGAVLAGEPYVYVRLEDNQYQNLMHSKKTGTLTEEERELLEMLD